MPKLTADSLKKKFTCQYCGKSVRTRQGLSGHIQFKHAKGKTEPYLDIKEVLLQAKIIELAEKSLGHSPGHNPVPSILEHWAMTLNILKSVDIKCNIHDFKNYMLVSLAQRAESERLRGQLANDFLNIIKLNK